MLGLEYSAGELVGNLRSSAVTGVFDAALNALPDAVFALLLRWGFEAALVPSRWSAGRCWRACPTTPGSRQWSEDARDCRRPPMNS
jgi:hypothetical protein